MLISSARFKDDDSAVSVTGILFAIQIEVKRVRNEDKEPHSKLKKSDALLP
jgi:hypothetical protein